MGAAAIAMLKLMTDVNVPAAVRLRAAEAVFSCGIKASRSKISRCAWRRSNRRRRREIRNDETTHSGPLDQGTE